jgi:hypothetical protein
MAILFYFSGKAAACGLHPDRKDAKINPFLVPLIWIKKKFLRLMVPLIFGTLIFVIPTSYIGRQYKSVNNSDPNMSFFEFYIRYFPDEFSGNGVEWL